MRGKYGVGLAVTVACATALVAITGPALKAKKDDARKFEVWTVDQFGPDPTAGHLYIYSDRDLTGNAKHIAKAEPEKYDLSSANALCAAQGAADPRPAPAGGMVQPLSRGHMGRFTADHRTYVLAFVLSGHILFIDTETRTPIRCIDVGAQAHAAFPSHDNMFVVVANQNGKLLQRINTDADGNGTPYENAGDIQLDSAATLNLAAGTTPSGALIQGPGRPDNAPICPVLDHNDQFVFVTLRGGGLLVASAQTSPMQIVAEYTSDPLSGIKPEGCGGNQRGDWMFINSGRRSNPTPDISDGDVYAFDVTQFSATSPSLIPNVPVPIHVFSAGAGQIDYHSMTLNPKRKGRYLWNGDRWANQILVFDTYTRELVNILHLQDELSADPAPDLMDTTPDGKWVFFASRGLCPTTANAAGANNAVGSSPGVGVIKVTGGGRSGRFVGLAPIDNPAPGGFDCPSRTDDVAGDITNRADMHALRIRIIDFGRHADDDDDDDD